MQAAMQLPREALLRAYRTMREIRVFEERVHVEFGTGAIPGFVHLYSGEEACATGVMMHLTDRDHIASTHRGHGHCIAKGCDIPAMMAEIFGKKDGLCGGKGGSMHIADLSKGMMGANGIVGGGPPLICGAALSAKIRKTGGVAIAFLGDGASNQGTTLESYNLAKVWNLPVVFVIEDNGYAEATPSSYSVAGDQLDRAKGFGLFARRADGLDFFAVYDAAQEVIAHAREGKGPALLHLKTNRFFGHYEGDAGTYRAKDEVAKLRAEKDCLVGFRRKVIEAGLLAADQMNAVDAAAETLVEGAVKGAKSGAMPVAADLLTDAYVAY